MKNLSLLIFCCYISAFFFSCKNKTDFSALTTSCMEYVRNQDYENAHIILDELYAHYSDAVSRGEGPLATALYGSDERYEAVSDIKSAMSAYNIAALQVYSSELRYLSSINEDEAWERALFLLKELPVIGIKYDNYTKSDNTTSKENVMIESYIQYVISKNQLCNLLLDLAIDNKKKDVAEKVINSFEENCKRDDDFSPIYYDDTDIQKAKEKYNKAIDNKVFNE